MKKILMTLVAVAMATTMNAQWYVGGGVGLATSSYDGNSTTIWSILPEVGYNINDKWAVGAGVGYIYQKSGDVKTNGFTIAPYARYTFVKWEKVNLFLDGTVGYKHENAAGVKTNTFGIGVKPGIAVNLNSHLSFVAHVGFLGYENEKVKGDDKSTNTFGVNLNGNNLSFGVYYNF